MKGSGSKCKQDSLVMARVLLLVALLHIGKIIWRSLLCIYSSNMAWPSSPFYHVLFLFQVVQGPFSNSHKIILVQVKFQYKCWHCVVATQYLCPSVFIFFQSPALITCHTIPSPRHCFFMEKVLHSWQKNEIDQMRLKAQWINYHPLVWSGQGHDFLSAFCFAGFKHWGLVTRSTMLKKPTDWSTLQIIFKWLKAAEAVVGYMALSFWWLVLLEGDKDKLC